MRTVEYAITLNDTETKLYYLQSHYYDPEIGRFVNGDEAEFAAIQSDPLGHNLFAYCGNDAVNCFDPDGYAKVMRKPLTYTQLMQRAQALQRRGITGSVLRAAKKCPAGVYKAIKDAKLHTYGWVLNKSGDMFESCVEIGNGFYIYSFSHAYSGTYKKTSHYLVGAMSKKRWDEYLKNTYRFLDEVRTFLSYFNEAAGMMVPSFHDWVVIGGFFAEQLLSIDPDKKKYIQKKSASLGENGYIALSVSSYEQVYTRIKLFSRQKCWKTVRSKKRNAW